MSLVMEVVACWLACVVLALNLVFFLVEKVRNKKVDLKPENNIIVITGCDSGFGEMTSRVLAKKGFRVISACLTDEGMKRLEDVVALTLKCDVTKENDITALAASISDYSTSTGCKVWGVVNNAGIVDGGNLDWTAMSVWRRVLEVNFFAVVAISKAMLPFLKRSPGSRIVNVSSLAGITGAPGMGPYFASKHAVEGMAKCAREELSHWDIHMSNINPGFMRTPLLASGSSAGKRSFESAPTEITSEYGTEWLEGQMETVTKLAENPKLVVDAIVDALTDSHPPMWYFPGNAAKVMRIAPMFSSGMWDFLRLFNGPSVARPTPEAIKKYR